MGQQMEGPILVFPHSSVWVMSHVYPSPTLNLKGGPHCHPVTIPCPATRLSVTMIAALACRTGPAPPWAPPPSRWTGTAQGARTDLVGCSGPEQSLQVKSRRPSEI